MSKRKIVLLASALCMVAILAIGGTLAYFTDTDSAENVFTVGNVEIELTEPNWEGSGSQDAPEVYPGEPLAKDPTVENVGANPCFVRIKVTGLDQFVKEYGDDAMITYRDAKYQVGKLNAGWEEYNGYFYWTAPLVVKDTESESWNEGLVSKTTPVFSSIVMPTQLTNGDADTEFSVDVYVEAVQAQGAKAPNWAAVKTMTVQEIAAWFDTCMPATEDEVEEPAEPDDAA